MASAASVVALPVRSREERGTSDGVLPGEQRHGELKACAVVSGVTARARARGTPRGRE